MNIGIEFTLNDGSKDSYDPVDSETGIEELEDRYIVDNGAYKYNVFKSDIKSIRKYELCPICGHEIYEDGCHFYHEK